MLLWKFPELRYRIAHEYFSLYFDSPPPAYKYERLGENGDLIKCTQDIFVYNEEVIKGGKLIFHETDVIYPIPDAVV